MTAIPARVFVLLSKNKETGVVFRRGPAKLVCSIGWDLRDDRFKAGQWLKGRIYERFSDLSPDGDALIYFARGRPRAKVGDCWTALAKPPYLKALGLWNGRWGSGGGLFVGKNRVWLPTGGAKPLRKAPGIEVAETCALPAPRDSWWLEVYGRRLLRDGWAFVDHFGHGRAAPLARFDKKVNAGWFLRKSVHQTLDKTRDHGGSYEDHELISSATGRIIPQPGWEWAETDRGEVLWAEGGRLYRGKVGPAGDLVSRMLKDFNEMKFEEKRAPY